MNEILKCPFDLRHKITLRMLKFGVSISNIRTTYWRQFKMCIHLLIKSTNITEKLNWETIEQMTVETSPT